MSGIILIYNKKPDDVGIQRIGTDIAERMYNYNALKSEDIVSGHKIFLRMMRKDEDYFGISNTDEGFFAWFGLPLYKGKTIDKGIFRAVKAEIYKRGISSVIQDISGHFQLAIYLRERGECYIVCDKTSSHPFYHTETENFMAFSPEPLTFKALKQYGWRSSIRKESVFEYLASGYLWGDECFLKEIKRLAPGQLICLNNDGIKIETYWKMIFEKSQATEQSLIGELFESIKKDISDLPKGNKILTLSGGYDSRALLGFLKNSNQQINTVSYSFGSKVNKGMDMDVGGYYAKKAGVSHSYYHAPIDDSSRLISDINNAVSATGGENYLSIFQDAFLGKEFYRHLADQYDYMIRGDEVWGWGDLAVNYDMAFWESRLFNLDEIAYPKKIMSPDVYDRGIKYIGGKRKEFIEECGTPKISANDLKDYLYWRHREARLLQSMAYFRRCFIPHFAPFLFDRTLSVIKKTPSKYRVQKNLFMQMGKKMFPELFLDKESISANVGDVNNFASLYKDKRFRSFIKGSLLESGSAIFSDLFDRKSFEPWIDSVLDGNAIDSNKLRQGNDWQRLAITLIGKSGYLKGCMKAVAVKKGSNIFPILNVNYLFRLVGLSLALKEYDNGC